MMRRIATLFIVVLCFTVLPILPVRAQRNGIDPTQVAPWLGRYSPNTTIELREDGLWFIRPPFASRLLPTPTRDVFTFEQGWIAGTFAWFSPNAQGGTSILLRDQQGNWNEFARSGELYPDFGPPLIGALEQALEQGLVEGKAPGTILYIAVPGRGMWMGARGLADRERGIPMTPYDRIRIASITKLFVATVAAQLVEEGWLPLNSTVEQWLPKLVPGGDRITIRQLMTHTSGVPDYLTDRFVDQVHADPSHLWTPLELVGAALQRPLRFAAGERWEYSNTNYILLGMVIEQVTHNTVEFEVRQRILKPLDLQRTDFDPPTSLLGVARGYAGTTDYSDLNLSCAWAAGAMTATMEELGHFAQALFGGKLVSLAMLQLMVKFEATGSLHPVGYGLGVMQDMLASKTLSDTTRLVWGHTGGLGGYRTVLWYLPKRGIVVTAAFNRYESDPNKVVVRVLEALDR